MALITRTTFSPKMVFVTCALALTLMYQIAPAFASCRYHTYMTINGIVTCATCCHGSVCNTFCY